MNTGPKMSAIDFVIQHFKKFSFVLGRALLLIICIIYISIGRLM